MIRPIIFRGRKVQNAQSIEIALQDDNSSNVLTFEMDRFFGEIDLGNYEIQLLLSGDFMATPNEDILTETTGLEKTVQTGRITVKWLITNEHTYTSGTGQAQFRFISSNGEVWHSDIFNIKVGSSLDVDGTVEAQQPSVITDHTSRLQSLENKTAESTGIFRKKENSYSKEETYSKEEIDSKTQPIEEIQESYNDVKTVLDYNESEGKSGKLEDHKARILDLESKLEKSGTGELEKITAIESDINDNKNGITELQSGKLNKKPNGTNDLLNVDYKINSAYIPDALLGALKYAGSFNSSGYIVASENFPQLENCKIDEIDTSLYKGCYFICEGNFSFYSISFNTGDKAICQGSTVNKDWIKIDNTDKVHSVNGKTGNVELNASDIPFDNSGSGLSSEDTDNAIKEVFSRVNNTRKLTTEGQSFLFEAKDYIKSVSFQLVTDAESIEVVYVSHIDWGDGTKENGSIKNINEFLSHSYSANGFYQIEIGLTATDNVSLSVYSGKNGIIEAKTFVKNITGFKDCEYLEKYTNTYAGFVTIKDRAFNDCIRLSDFSTTNLYKVGIGAFGNSAVNTRGTGERVLYYSSPYVNTLGNYAFSSSLTSGKVEYDDKQAIKAVGTYQYCKRITEVEVGGFGGCGDGVFQGCSSIQKITIKGCDIIGDNAFRGCPIREIILEGSVNNIGIDAFSGSKALIYGSYNDRFTFLPLYLAAGGELLTEESLDETSTHPLSNRFAKQLFDSKADISSLATKADLIEGKVPSSQLPSYVDDVIEFNSLSVFPETGESGKIYLDKATNKAYRWSGSTYTIVASDLALGETSLTAYRGDRGKTAYEHSQATGNPHGSTKEDFGLGNVDNTSDINKPISNSQQEALNNKVDKVTGKGLSSNDYTNTDRDKLLNIEAGAQVNEVGEAPLDGEAYLRQNGVWALAPTGGGGGVSSYNDLSDKPIEAVDTLPLDGLDSSVLYKLSGQFFRYSDEVWEEPLPGPLPDAYPTPGLDWTTDSFQEEGVTFYGLINDKATLLPIPDGYMGDAIMTYTLNGIQHKAYFTYDAEMGVHNFSFGNLPGQGIAFGTLAQNMSMDSGGMPVYTPGSSICLVYFPVAITSFEITAIEPGYKQLFFVDANEKMALNNSLQMDHSTGEGTKLYTVDNDGNQTMVTINQLKTLLGI